MALTPQEAQALIDNEAKAVETTLQEVITALEGAAAGKPIGFRDAQLCSVVASKALALGHAIVAQMGDND